MSPPSECQPIGIGWIVVRAPVRRSDVRARRASGPSRRGRRHRCAWKRFARSSGNAGTCEMHPAEVRAMGRTSVVHDLAVGDERRRAGQVERVVLAAPACRRDRTQAGDPAARELADAARPQPVVAEERERVLQALRERREWSDRWCRVLVQEVDPQPGRLRALAVEREERVVHRVEVLVREPATAGCERGLGVEGARVTVRGDAEAREVLQCALGGALPRLRGEELVPELGQRAGRPGGAAADRAVGGDDDPPRFEPGLRGAVRPRAALRRLDVDRTVDRVELGQGRQTLLGELHGRDRADRGDELARRDVGAHAASPRSRRGS